MSIYIRVLACGLVLYLLATDSTQGQARSASVWMTSADRAFLLTRVPDVAVKPDDPAIVPTVDLFPTDRYQPITGFGASLTESSAYLLQTALSDTARRSLMLALFHPASGAGLGVLRQPMGASDFALDHYSYDDIPSGQMDPLLQQFSIARDRQYVLPAMHEALAINPNIVITASPWSAPGWMKTSGSMIGGSLRSDRYAPFADYFVKFLNAYAAERVPIDFVTVVNEPHYAPLDYPGMYMNAADQTRFIRDFLGPALGRAGLPTRILTWDHNWHQAEYPIAVMNDTGARPFVAGSAFHCYVGDPSMMEAVKAAHPDRSLHITECSSFSTGVDFGWVLLWNARTLLTGALRHWAESVVTWNLVLDEQGGPHKGGCTDCTGLATINQATGAVTLNAEYYALAHVSKFMRPGAERIGSSRFATTDLDAVAVQNPDGTNVVLLTNTAYAPRRVKVRLGGEATTHDLPARSVATVVWPSGAVDPPQEIEPIPIPGVIEAERFGTGGAGLSYVDTTVGNAGGQYRTTDVDIEASSDSGGGYNVGWTRAGEWLAYPVDVATSGVYTWAARVASSGSGGTFHVEVDGVNRTGSIAIPDTGGWQSWTTVALPNVTLAAGRRLMRLVIDTNGPANDAGNINFIRVAAANGDPYLGKPAAIPGVIEAEMFDNGGNGVAYADVTPENAGGAFRTTAVDLESSVEGAFNVGWMAPGEWLKYGVEVLGSGTYRLNLRVAAHGDGGRLHVEFDGVNKTGPLKIPDTGGWQTWTTIGAPVTLTAGVQSMRVVVESAGAGGVVGNLNFIELLAGSVPRETDIVIYANDIPSTDLHGGWSRGTDPRSPSGVTVQTFDNAYAAPNSPLVAPLHYVDVKFTPVPNAPYTVWLRLKAAPNNKYNDSVWLQFSNARSQGAAAYPLNSSNGLLVNLATDGTGSSLADWGWANNAYWLTQATTLTFPVEGTQTLRIQVREDGVQFDQIVLSPMTYLNSPPGARSNDSKIVPR
jgi:O-glycosyl hydrolase